jgi:hypothetical protein
MIHHDHIQGVLAAVQLQAQRFDRPEQAETASSVVERGSRCPIQLEIETILKSSEIQRWQLDVARAPSAEVPPQNPPSDAATGFSGRARAAAGASAKITTTIAFREVALMMISI